MKRLFFVYGIMLVAFLFSRFAMPVASAQGEWKWANYWSSTGSSGQYYSHVTKTAFDEDGNIYVLGEMGGLPIYNGQTFHFTDKPQVFASNNQACLLAKFDTLGNMLWYKVIRSSGEHAHAHWMELRGDKIYISFNMFLDYVDWSVTVNNVWVYYFDTLITGPQVHEIPEEQRRPPYKTGRYTCFATFDLDGNMLDNHFVEARTREILPAAGGVRGEVSLCDYFVGYTPFHVDKEGNTYVFTTLTYAGFESDPFTIIVDGDTNKQYDVYLPGNSDVLYDEMLETVMKYKFSPDWELLYASPMVDRKEGIATSWELLHDSVNTHCVFKMCDLPFDEDDNMYLSGFLWLPLSGDYGGDLHQYPIRIYLDSTHYISLNDMTSTFQTGFVIKFDTGGTVQWCNQTFTRGDHHQAASAAFTGSCVYDGSIYVTGQGGVFIEGQNGLVYFDDESHPLQIFQQCTSEQTFFVRYDAQTGHYLNQGVVPVENVTCGRNPTITNNRVFAYAQQVDHMICQWGNDGLFLDKMDITGGYFHRVASLLVNSRGYLLFDMGVEEGPVIFSSSVVADCTPGRYNAVLALYHDPEFATPYVGIANRGEHFSDLKIWPNPTSNILYVGSDRAPIDYITIMDLNGKTLVKERVGNYCASVDVSRLPAGTYLLETVGEGEVSVGKFVKTQ